MTEREDFLARRRRGVGGSDIGAIIGVDRYSDALDVYLSKVEGKESEENEAMIRGRMLEDVVAQCYLDATGRKVRKGKYRVHRQHKIMHGHPDRIIVATTAPPYAEPHDAAGVLELKTANRFAFAAMKKNGLPDSYVLQLQHYMAITGCSWGSLAILCPDPWEFVTFDMDFDSALYERVVRKCEAFWTDHVLAGDPPRPDQTKWEDAPPPKEGEAVHEREDDEWDGAVGMYRQAKEIHDGSKGLLDMAKAELQALMVENGVYEGSGARVYLREQKGRRSLQRKSLEAHKPLDRQIMSLRLTDAGVPMEDIAALFEGAELDIGSFDKIGVPFTTMRVYDTKETTDGS